MKVTYYVPESSATAESLSMEALAPVSVRAFLRQKCNFSHGLWRRLKWNGIIKVNDMEVRATTAMARPGDKIECIIPEESSLAATPMPLDIRYEDDSMIILNKPAGILVHPTGGDHYNTLGNGLVHYYQITNQNVDFHPVHRLDRNTTGLVLVAKLPQLQNTLTQSNGRDVATGKLFHRSYIAVIQGRLDEPEGTIDFPIKRHPESIIQRICAKDGQKAITHYKTLSYANGKSLLELKLETGRTHQIRVHLAALGHPLLGDDLYGGDTSLIQRQALHAYHLEVHNHLTGQNLSIYSDIPQDILHCYNHP